MSTAPKPLVIRKLRRYVSWHHKPGRVIDLGGTLYRVGKHGELVRL